MVGVDISVSQVELARANVPSAQFIHGDIISQDFAEASFDVAIAFYLVVHLPRSEQQGLLVNLGHWIRPGGSLLATLPGSDHPGYTKTDSFGATMYWSHYETSWYAERLVEAGFDIIHLGVLEHGYRHVPGLPPERHPVVLAQLRAKPLAEQTHP